MIMPKESERDESSEGPDKAHIDEMSEVATKLSELCKFCCERDFMVVGCVMKENEDSRQGITFEAVENDPSAVLKMLDYMATRGHMSKIAMPLWITCMLNGLAGVPESFVQLISKCALLLSDGRETQADPKALIESIVKLIHAYHKEQEKETA